MDHRFIRMSRARAAARSTTSRGVVVFGLVLTLIALVVIAGFTVAARADGEGPVLEASAVGRAPELSPVGDNGVDVSAPESSADEDSRAVTLVGDTGPPATDPNAPQVWTLSDSHVISPGVSVDIEDGIYVSGYIVECAASTGSQEDASSAVFRAELSAFRPSHDMTGQEAGIWYVRGSWEIRTGESTVRHDNLVAGTLAADSTDKPFGGTPLLAAVNVPASIGADGYLRGEGEFEGSGEFEGDLTLRMERR